MNARQEELYKYLLSKGDEWTTHAEIARELYQYYGNAECCLEPKDYHNSTERTLITKDCREISTSTECEKIIISSSKGVKIANEAEAERYLRNQYKALFRKLKRIRTMERKCNLHNQMDFGGHTVEAFLEKLPETT
jgi:hypothetical protein